jgi:hypothetical protein
MKARVEQSRDVLCSFQVTAHPKQRVGDTTEHKVIRDSGG